jgi:hypothetical protein
VGGDLDGLYVYRDMGHKGKLRTPLTAVAGRQTRNQLPLGKLDVQAPRMAQNMPKPCQSRQRECTQAVERRPSYEVRYLKPNPQLSNYWPTTNYRLHRSLRKNLCV